MGYEGTIELGGLMERAELVAVSGQPSQTRSFGELT